MKTDKYVIRSSACSLHCGEMRDSLDSFYLNGQLPQGYLPDNTQFETTKKLSDGVFAVFSKLSRIDRGVINSIDNFRENIINADKVAIRACMHSLETKIKFSKDYSFALLRVKDGIARIAYKGNCNVYIFRGGHTIPLINAKNAPADNDGTDDGIFFTPEFKFVDSDAVVLSTEGVAQRLNAKVLTHILSETKTSKAAARSIAISAGENACDRDATAMVLRISKEEFVEEENKPKSDSDIVVNNASQTQNQSANKVTATKTTAVEEKPLQQNTGKDTNIDADKASNDNEPTTVFTPVKPGKADTSKQNFDDENEYITEIDNAFDGEEDDEESGSLSTATWIVTGILTAALGVIGGLIALIYI